MKAKLYKVLDQYHLYDGDKAIATTIVGNPMLLPNLSKQNCDEIFGVVDVEKLAKNDPNGYYESDYQNIFVDGFINGFNKAMELNRFTLEDIRKAYYIGYEDGKSGATFFQQLIQSLQQPTEVEVMIVMEEVQEIYRDGTVKWERCPKLDSSGQLILKKI